jgi:polyisoprenoid-binding protein YceI
MKTLLKLGLISIVSSGLLMAATFNVDTAHSHVGFKVKHLMISNVKGDFKDFSGAFEYDEKTHTLKALDGKVMVKSVNTDNEKRDAHLRSEDFFYADKYPEMTFVLTKVDGEDAYGKLTMRGVTKDVKLEVETSGVVIKDPWGGERTGLTLSGKINRKDFGLVYNSIIETGGLAIGDEVKIEVEIEGIKTK